MTVRSPLAQRLPAAAVRIWPAGETPAGEATSDPIPGLLELGSGLFVVVPTAGQAAIFDLAVLHARRVLEAARRRQRRSPARAFVWPATFELATRLGDDATLTALERHPPDLRHNGIYLAGQAGNLLESGWALHDGGAWSAGPHPQVRLLRVGARRIHRLPWRNPEALGAGGRTIARPELTARLAELARAPLVVVRGPLGVGKSRAVWEWLQGRGEPALWLRPDLGAAGLTLPAQLVRQTALLARSLAAPAKDDAWAELRRAAYGPQPLAEALALVTWRWLGRGERPLTVVFDGLEAVDPLEREFLARLVELPQLGRSLRLDPGRPRRRRLDRLLAGRRRSAGALPQRGRGRRAGARAQLRPRAARAGRRPHPRRRGRESLRLRGGSGRSPAERTPAPDLRQLLLRRRRGGRFPAAAALGGARRGRGPPPRRSRPPAGPGGGRAAGAGGRSGGGGPQPGRRRLGPVGGALPRRRDAAAGRLALGTGRGAGLPGNRAGAAGHTARRGGARAAPGGGLPPRGAQRAAGPELAGLPAVGGDGGSHRHRSWPRRPRAGRSPGREDPATPSSPS